jgi:DNA-binding transcriptional LysR family regulator
VASGAYVGEKGLPQNPDQLAAHRVLALAPRDERAGRYVWDIEEVTAGRKKPQTTAVALQPVMVCNDPEPILQSVMGDEGIGFIPDLFIREPLRRGAIVQVLPGWQGPSVPINAVYLSRRGLSPKVRVFVDFLGEQLLKVGTLTAPTAAPGGAQALTDSLIV